MLPTLSRFTDPGEYGHLLDPLPEDPVRICQIARRQTIHHNLLPYFGVPRQTWETLTRVWPPRLRDILRALEDVAPHALVETREPEQRVVGACMLESHLLAGMLRRKGIRVRIRAGYFRDVRANSDHVLRFWGQVMCEKRVAPELLERDPEAWREAMNAYTARKNEIDHRIEHWICEYWDEGKREWRLLDANDTFLEAHGGLAVGFHLPRRHFEFAHEAWRRIRTGAHDPDQYAEEPQDGRSHVRSQLLWDYYSLLNHDLAGVDIGDGADHEFVKRRAWDELSDTEFEELDRLAGLLSRDPPTDELVAFYRATPGLRIAGADQDPHSFVHA